MRQLIAIAITGVAALVRGAGCPDCEKHAECEARWVVERQTHAARVMAAHNDAHAAAISSAAEYTRDVINDTRVNAAAEISELHRQVADLNRALAACRRGR